MRFGSKDSIDTASTRDKAVLCVVVVVPLCQPQIPWGWYTMCWLRWTNKACNRGTESFAQSGQSWTSFGLLRCIDTSCATFSFR